MHVLVGISEYLDNLKQVKEILVDGKDSYLEIKHVDLVYKTANSLRATIIKSLQKYYNGQPSEAYEEFRDGIINGVLTNKNFSFKSIREDDKLYRIRCSKNEESFEPKGLFHIPMNDREKVASQRFSIPGYPCLYFSNSTYLCWLELGRPDIFKCHASKFQVVNDINSFEEIRLLNLTNIHPQLYRQSKGKATDWHGKIIRYLSLWPLIYSTSVQVKYPERYFKPEYIIPQLLMQFIQDTKTPNDVKLHGIKYSSTHFDLHNSDENFFNVAIPIHASSKVPYCNFLTKKFKFTQPVSWEHLNILNGEFEKIFVTLAKEGLKEKEDKRQKRAITLIPGTISNYDVSKFGIMEQYLEECDLKHIDVNGNLK